MFLLILKKKFKYVYCLDTKWKIKIYIFLPLFWKAKNFRGKTYKIKRSSTNQKIGKMNINK